MTAAAVTACSIEDLTARVLRANQRLVEAKLVSQTWGNASGADRAAGIIVIKPSGVAFADLTAAAMTVLSMDGTQIGGELRPSSDAPTHVELYRAFPAIGGIVHTHSEMASAWAQAGRSIPMLGTTHADCFAGAIACTRWLSAGEIAAGYERQTGCVIAETVGDADPLAVPAVLVRGHGPFTWGRDVEDAQVAAEELELVARLATATMALDPGTAAIAPALARYHHQRKHGPDAYYGQLVECERPAS
jgi:L-ribulose-5-phosphate 4-epimerase